MNALTDKIAALPEWPEGRMWNPKQIAAAYESAAARLALVLELAKDGNPILVDHLDHCYTDQRSTDSACTCGRDALLAALEVPK